MSDKTRYSDEELDEFKSLIEGKMNDVREEINYFKDSLEKLKESTVGDGGSYDEEDGSSSMEKEKLMNNLERQRKFLLGLENALIRIENKTYGICRDTGKLIKKQRLMLVPHATLSIEAKEKREQR